MSRFGGLCGLAVAFAGVLAAHALALQVPPLPGVTVTTPSLPVTTALPPPPPLPITTALPPLPPSLPVTTALPPLPQPPPVTVPPVTVKTPPVTVKTPPVTVKTPPVAKPSTPSPVAPRIVTTPTRPAAGPAASAPTGRTAGPTEPTAGSASQSGGSAGTTSSSTSRTGPTRRSQPAVATRTNKLGATQRRTKGRVSVRLAFTLSKAQRLFLIVRGPVPSCQVVGVIPVRGKRGVNKLTFSGRAKGRNLRPGSYLLSLSTVRQPLPTAPATLVKVVSKRRSVPAKPGARKPTCADAQASTSSPSYSLWDREGARPGLNGADTGAGTARGGAVSSVAPANSDGKHDVLGVASPGAGLDSGDSSVGGIASFVAIAILTLLGAILLATVALVTRFFRGSWNP